MKKASTRLDRLGCRRCVWPPRPWQPTRSRWASAGYYTFYGAAGNIDPTYAFNGSFTSYKGFAFIQEGEIHFIGQTKLDNGTSVGLTVELEAWNPSSAVANAQIDEAFLFAFGDWGRVELGSPRRGDLPYVLRHAVGVHRLGRHSAQP